MKKSPRTLTELDVQLAHEKVERALTQLLSNFPHDLPSSGPWWLDPESTEAEVLHYSAVFGRDHLAECATGLTHDRNANRYSTSDLVIDVNGAAGLIGLMLVLVGLAERLIVVDHCAAAGVVAQKLAALLGVECTYRDVSNFHSDATTDMTIESVFVLSSHAQNVLFFDEERDAALEIQNQNLLQALAESFPNLTTLSAISLEPSRGRRGLENLLNPWRENFQILGYSQVPVAKFGRGLRIGHKKYESTILAKESVSV
jgi:hypothetical protein